MLNLTRLEQQALIFVICSLLVGGGVTLVRSYQQDVAIPSALTSEGQEIGRNLEDTTYDTLHAVSTENNQVIAIHLNTATSRQLQSLPGVGPKLAERILTYRAQQGDFQTVDQLLSVKGIGPSVLSRIKPLVTVP